MEKRIAWKTWLPVLGLTCAAFVFNTSEFIPIGLLTDIGSDFSLTEARAGVLISAYAWVVTLLSLPLMLMVSTMELRKLLLSTIALFVVFQLLSSLSAGYTMLMLSRMGVACTHAVFWSVVSPLAVSIVPDRHRALALSMIVTGTSVAMIFGLPLGRVIGLSIGWRMTFLWVGVFAFAILCYLAFFLPKVPSRGRFSLHQLPGLFKNPLLLGIYLFTFGMATAYYTGYSYIEPFLKQVAGMDDGWITATLMLFGAMGIAGSFSFSRFYAKQPYRFMNIVVLCVAGCLLCLHVFSLLSPLVIVLCAVWGMAVTAFNVALQAEIINYSPQDATAVSMSVFSGIFNLGIGCGTSLGGSVCTYFSLSDIGYAGGVVALVAFAYWHGCVRRHLQRAAGKAGR